jgi:hypothetical protein
MQSSALRVGAAFADEAPANAKVITTSAKALPKTLKEERSTPE